MGVRLWWEGNQLYQLTTGRRDMVGGLGLVGAGRGGRAGYAGAVGVREDPPCGSSPVTG